MIPRYHGDCCERQENRPQDPGVEGCAQSEGELLCGVESCGGGRGLWKAVGAIEG